MASLAAMRAQGVAPFLEAIRKHYANDPAVFENFVNLINKLNMRQITIENVMEDSRILFQATPELYANLPQYLPFMMDEPTDPHLQQQQQQQLQTLLWQQQQQQLQHQQMLHHQSQQHLAAVNTGNAANSYVAMIQERFRHRPDVYPRFQQILQSYSRGADQQVFQRVQELFQGHDDLIAQFEVFLAEESANTQPVQQPQRPARMNKREKRAARQDARRAPRSTRTDGAYGNDQVVEESEPKSNLRIVSFPAGSERQISVFERIKQALSAEAWSQLLRSLNLFSNDIVSRPELVWMVEDILGDKVELAERFRQAIDYDEWEEKQLLTQRGTNYYAFVTTIDLASCPAATPSYRQLPEGLQLPPCSGRTPLADSVLNNSVISTSIGSEDVSFKATRRNTYEENLFKCEDDRYELDMLIETNASLMRVLEALAAKIASLPPTLAQRVRLGRAFDMVHVRALYRVYGEAGHEVVHLLRRSPASAVNVVLARLKQKDDEWRRVRIDMRQTWRRICENNYHRSLDHRSFYFKQEDKKRRSAKALLAELKELQQNIFGKYPQVLPSGESSAFHPIPVANNIAQAAINAGATGVISGEASIYAIEGTTTDNSVPLSSTSSSSNSSSSSSSSATSSVANVLATLSSPHLLTAASAFSSTTLFTTARPPFYTYPIRYSFADQFVHALVYRLLTCVAPTLLRPTQFSAFQTFWTSFVDTFFAIPSSITSLYTPSQAFTAALEAEKSGVYSLPERTIPPIPMPTGDETGDEKEGEESLATLVVNAAHATAALASDDVSKGGKKGIMKGGKIGEEDEEEEEQAPVNKRKPPPKKKAVKGKGALKGKRKADDGMDDGEGGEPQDDGESGSGIGKSENDGDVSSSQNLSSSPSTSSSSSSASSSISSFSSSSSSSSTTTGSSPLGPVSSAAEPILRALRTLSPDAPGGTRFKPSSVQTSSYRLEEKVVPIRTHSRQSHLLMCDQPLYIFLRLYQLLYERLLAAFQLALLPPPHSGTKRRVPQSSAARLLRFIDLTVQLCENKIDANKFEDECRTLFTAAAFMLFTLDRIVHQLLEHCQALFTSEKSKRLLLLYTLHRERSAAVSASIAQQKLSQAAIVERVTELVRQYQHDALLESEDNLVQAEYFLDTHDLGLGLVDNVFRPVNHYVLPATKYLESFIVPRSLTLSVHSSVANQSVRDAAVAKAEATYAMLVEQQAIDKAARDAAALAAKEPISDEPLPPIPPVPLLLPSPYDVVTSKPFLARNVRRMLTDLIKPRYASSMKDANSNLPSLIDVWEGTVVFNGLRFRIHGTKLRIAYEEETSDVFARLHRIASRPPPPSPERKAAIRQAKSNRYNQWYANTIQAMTGLNLADVSNAFETKLKEIGAQGAILRGMPQARRISAMDEDDQEEDQEGAIGEGGEAEEDEDKEVELEQGGMREGEGEGEGEAEEGEQESEEEDEVVVAESMQDADGGIARPRPHAAPRSRRGPAESVEASRESSPQTVGGGERWEEDGVNGVRDDEESVGGIPGDGARDDQDDLEASQ